MAGKNFLGVAPTETRIYKTEDKRGGSTRMWLRENLAASPRVRRQVSLLRWSYWKRTVECRCLGKSAP